MATCVTYLLHACLIRLKNFNTYVYPKANAVDYDHLLVSLSRENRFPDETSSKVFEIEEDDFGEKVGIWDMDFPQGHVGKRDLKRKCEEHHDFTNGKGSTLWFPLSQVRP